MSDKQMMIEIGANVTSAVSGLNQVAVSGAKMQTTLAKLPNTSNQATQSLINLSRVAQDAPYGFIGIANNLNPLLESFQRLKQSTGSTGTALTALKGALTGPAGIGLALGVVSSLLISFGDKLFGSSVSFSKAEIAAGRFEVALKNLRVQVSNLKSELEFEASVKKLALQFSSLSGGKLTAAETGVDISTNAQLVSGLTEKINQLTSANKKLLQVRIDQEKVAARITGQVTPLGKLFLEFGGDIPSNLSEKLNKADKAILSQYQRTNDTIKELNKERVSALLNIGIAPLKAGASIRANIEKLKINPKVIELERPLSDYNITRPEGKDFSINTDKLKAGGIQKSMTDSFDGLNARMKNMRIELEKQLDFAKYVAGNISNAFGTAFDKIASGENVFKSLGEAIKQLVVDMIKAALQAFIFNKIIGLFVPGAGKLGLGGAGGLFGLSAGALGGGVTALSPGAFGSGNGGGLAGRVVFEIAGDRLIGVLNNGQRSQIRRGG